MLKDLREIAPRGVIDIATGVAIGMTVGTLMGVAFSKLVISVLNDLVYPILGALMGGLDFSDTYIMLRGKAPDGTSLAEARTLGTPLPIGELISVLINSIVLVVVAFFIIKLVSKIIHVWYRPAPSDLPTDVKLLKEIRDILARRSA